MFLPGNCRVQSQTAGVSLFPEEELLRLFLICSCPEHPRTVISLWSWNRNSNFLHHSSVSATLNQSPFMADVHSCISQRDSLPVNGNDHRPLQLSQASRKPLDSVSKRCFGFAYRSFLFPLPYSSVPECSSLTFPHLLTLTPTVSENPRQVDYRFTHKAGRTAPSP